MRLEVNARWANEMTEEKTNSMKTKVLLLLLLLLEVTVLLSAPPRRDDSQCQLDPTGGAVPGAGIRDFRGFG